MIAISLIGFWLWTSKFFVLYCTSLWIKASAKQINVEFVCTLPKTNNTEPFPNAHMFKRTTDGCPINHLIGFSRPPKNLQMGYEHLCQSKDLKIVHTATEKAKHFPANPGFIYLFFYKSTASSNPPSQSASNLPPPTPRTSIRHGVCTEEWVNSCQLPSAKELHDAGLEKKKGRKDCHRGCTPRQPSARKTFLWETVSRSSSQLPVDLFANPPLLLFT